MLPVRKWPLVCIVELSVLRVPYADIKSVPLFREGGQEASWDPRFPSLLFQGRRSWGSVELGASLGHPQKGLSWGLNPEF